MVVLLSFDCSESAVPASPGPRGSCCFGAGGADDAAGAGAFAAGTRGGGAGVVTDALSPLTGMTMRYLPPDENFIAVSSSTISTLVNPNVNAFIKKSRFR